MSAAITIKGRIGKDMDIKFTQAGKAYVPFSVVSNTRKKVNEEWVDADTSWWECKAFGGYAEALVDNIRSWLILLQSKLLCKNIMALQDLRIQIQLLGILQKRCSNVS